MLDRLELLDLISIPSYNLLAGIGLVLGFLYFENTNKIQASETFKIYNIVFISIIFAFLGSRIYDILFSNISINLNAIIYGSSAFLGGFIFFSISFLLLSYFFKLKPLSLFSQAIEPILIIHFIGRIGCFLAGCCFGKLCPESFPFGVTFPHNSIPYNLYGTSHTIHPTQLYEAFGIILIFLLIKKTFYYKIPLYLILYGTIRFFVEIFRNDERGVFLFDIISPSQLTSILLILLGSGLVVVIHKSPVLISSKISIN